MDNKTLNTLTTVDHTVTDRLGHVAFTAWLVECRDQRDARIMHQIQMHRRTSNSTHALCADVTGLLKNESTFTVYFRTGGTANFKWQRVSEKYATDSAAIKKCDELRQAGYRANYVKTTLIDSIGLPETYSAERA